MLIALQLNPMLVPVLKTIEMNLYIVMIDQDNDFTVDKLGNINSISTKNFISENELANKTYVDIILGNKTFFRYNATVGTSLSLIGVRSSLGVHIAGCAFFKQM